MTVLDKIYAEILSPGLVRLRTWCDQSNVDAARMEAEHLHNLPSLMGETNPHRHIYYLEDERRRYLNSVDRLLAGMERGRVLQVNSRLWVKLAAEVETTFGVRAALKEPRAEE